MTDAVEAFLLSRQVMGCTAATLGYYREVLGRLCAALPRLEDCKSLAVQTYLSQLRNSGIRPVTLHKHFRGVRTFFRWGLEAGVLPEDPMRGLSMRTPKTLPIVPEDDAVRKLLAACPETFEGRRNRALIALLADSGLRIGEALRLRIEDMNFAARTVNVRAGKGQKDAVGFFGAETARHVREWVSRRRDAHPEDFLFSDREGRSMTRRTAAKILHRLSNRAGLPRKIGPHALRHYAATSILKQTGDLELVRQVLRHETLAMSLRYARLTRPDVTAKFRRASPLDNLRAGR